MHPAYYYHYGYFETPDEIEEGFYETSDLIGDKEFTLTAVYDEYLDGIYLIYTYL